MRKLRRLNVLLVVALLFSVFTLTAYAQEKTLYWENYDVDITVQPNGDFRVVETQQLVFTSGTFRFGARSIPTEFVSGISDVAVGEAGGPVYKESDTNEPFTFSTYQDPSNFNIRYNFPPTSDADRTMILEYTVSGGLLYYPGGDQLVWKAVPSSPNFPIQHSSATVHLPPGTKIDNYDATGPKGTATLIDNGEGAQFTATEPIYPGSADFAVRVQWPHGVVAGAPAGWQEAMDRQDRIAPVANVGTLSLTVFILVIGFLGLYLLWYSKGRDAPVKLPADWIAEPPSDLPPGMVGTLVDERADTKDVIATLVDLARRGVLAIEEQKKPGALGIGEKRDYVYHLENDALPMRPYERLLVDKLFDDDKEKKLSDLKEKFYTTMGQVQKNLYEATVKENYFPASPERIRSTYGVLGVLALVLSFVVGCVVLMLLSTYSNFALCVPVAFALPAIGLIVLARHMPRKTPNGAEESAKWLAFKRYMEDIEKYTKVDEVKEIFDKYLPYAIAFGLETSWIQKFARVDAAPPPWYYPGPYLGPRPRTYMWWGPTMTGGMPSGGSPSEGGRPPTLSDASRGMGSSLSNMSAGLGGMLTAASSTLTSRPMPQAGSGSWSSGGGSWSGGGGFSGGGWSGGGGFGGGGGGGSSFG